MMSTLQAQLEACRHEAWHVVGGIATAHVFPVSVDLTRAATAWPREAFENPMHLAITGLVGALYECERRGIDPLRVYSELAWHHDVRQTRVVLGDDRQQLTAAGQAAIFMFESLDWREYYERVLASLEAHIRQKPTTH